VQPSSLGGGQSSNPPFRGFFSNHLGVFYFNDLPSICVNGVFNSWGRLFAGAATRLEGLLKNFKPAGSTIALVLAATPARALPQWVQVSNGSFGACSAYANYNSVRGVGRVRTVDVTISCPENSPITGSFHIDCPSWRYVTSYEGQLAGNWANLSRGHDFENVAYLVCPASLTK
jgi:hypothetical protein